MGSYNYLGFAEGENGPTTPDVEHSIRKWGVGCASTRQELGTDLIHVFHGKRQSLKNDVLLVILVRI